MINTKSTLSDIHRLKWPAVALALLGLLLCLPVAGGARPLTIKIAVVTPEGSAWVKTLRELTAAVKTETRGEVGFKIYAGGVSGDEADVLRKMRANRLHAAGFSGVGLGIILPSIRILEAPLLFKDDTEIDLVKNTLYDDFAAAFEKKGFILLGFAEAGLVYLFSQRNLAEEKTFNRIKMWVWKGDRVAETFLSTFGITAYPLHLADVNTGLETGMIDSFYSPPLAAIAFQWYAKVRFVLDYPLVNSTGALLMSKRTFARLSPPHQAILRKLARDYCDKLVRRTRKDNREALGVLAETGLEFVSPTAAQLQSFHRNAKRTYAKSIPATYPKQLYDKVVAILEQHRQPQ